MWTYPEIRTLGELTAYHARHDPARLALCWDGRRIAFGALDAMANQVAHALIGRGLARHGRLAFLGRNSLDFYLALFGTAKTEGCFVPLNWRLAAVEQAALILDSDVRLAIVERAFEAVWREAGAIAGTEIETIVIDAADTLERHVAGQPSDRPAIAAIEQDGVVQLYTSGTTGRPKGVVLTHSGFNHMRLCEHLEPAYDWHDGDIFLNSLPNFHLLHIGIAIQCLYNGVAVSILRQFEPAEMLAAIGRDRPSLITLTPTMLQMLLDHPAAAATDFGSVRLTLYAGSPISLGLIKRAIAMMPCRFMQFYGATEANGAFAILRPDEHDLGDERKLQSCGRPLPLIAFRIVDAEGRDVAEGEAGELLVRSPAIMGGYWRQEDATAAVMKDGWYRSGDVAWRDDEGLYYIVDRVKDMIVSGGENIYSAEVENALSTHPAVAAVAVIGVPDARWGEAVKAIVIARGGVACAEADLLQHCRARLAAYKIPKSVDFVDAFPLVGTGKVSKKELRARYWAGASRDVA